MLNTTFVISGGAGRVVTCIPALEKYARLNPDDDFRVLVHGWHQLFWSHPLLQKRTFNALDKGSFEQHIKNNNVVVPEPYHRRSFYNQEKNLIQVFDEIINNTNDHSDLTKPNLYLTKLEIEQAAQIKNQILTDQKKEKFVVIQPYGSGCQMINNNPIDKSNRSIRTDHYLKIAQSLHDRSSMIYASPNTFKHIDDPAVPIDQFSPYFRILMGLIYHCDYFIGCDSVGQHVAYAFNKPGVVMMGATNEVMFSYTDHFKVIRRAEQIPEFSPWRLIDVDVDFSDRTNDGIMDFSDEDIQSIIQLVKKELYD